MDAVSVQSNGSLQVLQLEGPIAESFGISTMSFPGMSPGAMLEEAPALDISIKKFDITANPLTSKDSSAATMKKAATDAFFFKLSASSTRSESVRNSVFKMRVSLPYRYVGLPS